MGQYITGKINGKFEVIMQHIFMHSTS